MANAGSGAKPGTEAARFVRELERLLQSAREAAASTLLSGALRNDPVASTRFPYAPVISSGGLTLFSCTTDVRQQRTRVIVQLQGGREIYEGEAVSMDVAESPGRTTARAALAAVAEWADGRARFGLGEVLPVDTGSGPGFLVTVMVGDDPDALHPLIGCAWQGSHPHVAVVQAVLDACNKVALPESKP